MTYVNTVKSDQMLLLYFFYINLQIIRTSKLFCDVLYYCGYVISAYVSASNLFTHFLQRCVFLQ